MISAILAFFTALPSLVGGFEAFTKAHYDAKVRITTAQIGGDIEKGKQLVSAANEAQHERTATLGVIAGSKILLCLVVAFAAPLVIFQWKIIVVDIVIGPGSFMGFSWAGSTDPIRGQVADWANTIIWAIFGSGTAVTTASMWFAKK